MGMYTEFLIDCRLTVDMPESVKTSLRLLIHEREHWFLRTFPDPFAVERDRSPQGAAFFVDQRFDYLGSPHDTPTMFAEPAEWSFADDQLRIGTEVKNYDGVLDKFWAWISPWIAEAEGTRIGWCKYEECDNPIPVVVGQPLLIGEGFQY